MAIKKFRKKPVVVECIQWDGTNFDELQDWAGSNVKLTNDVQHNHLPPQLWVYDKMHETWIKVFEGHRIIKGTEGEFYPHSGDNWDKVYEEVVD